MFYLLRSFASFFLLGFDLFRKFGFLLGSQMANDDFAFRNDLDLKIHRHLTMKSERDVKLAQALDRFAQVQAIVKERCTGCHANTPTQPGFNAPPKGVMFDTPGQILAQAAQIHQQTMTRVMPLANLTHMTDDERATVAAWFQRGAPK